MANNSKAKIEKTVNGLNIIIPSKKKWQFLLFGSAWLGVWIFLLIFVTREFIFSETRNLEEIDWSLVNGLIFATVMGFVVAILLLWGYFGQEKFFTEKNEVIFEKTVLNIGKKNRLSISRINNFRTEFGKNDNWLRNWFERIYLKPWGLGTGKIKFDYGLKTYSFGLGVEDAEANYIVGLLKRQFKEG